MSKKNPIIVVEWEDISGYSSWNKEEDIKNMRGVDCTTIGWRCESDTSYLRVASTKDARHKYCDITVIPRKNVRKIRRLQEPKRK